MGDVWAELFGFFIPFIGLGSSHGTLRFAAIAR